MAGSHYSRLLIRQSSTRSKLNMRCHFFSSIPSPQPPPPNRGQWSSVLSSFLSSFRGFRLGPSLIGAGTDLASSVPDVAASDDNDVTGRRFKFSKSDVQSDEAIWTLYERWCLHHKIHRSRFQMIKRFPNFRWFAKHVYDFNCRNCSYTLSLNRFADETQDEMRKGCTFPFPCWTEDIKKLEEESKLSSPTQEAHGDAFCPICRQAFCESHPSVVIGCNHEFHILCILKWRFISCKCRVCWQPISLKDPTRKDFDKSDLEKDKVLWALYERWYHYHGLCMTPEDMRERFDFIRGYLGVRAHDMYNKLEPSQWMIKDPRSLCMLLPKFIN